MKANDSHDVNMVEKVCCGTHVVYIVVARKSVQCGDKDKIIFYFPFFPVKSMLDVRT